LTQASHKVALRARKLLDLNKPAAVLELVAPAIASDPDNATLHSMMAAALERSGRYEEAIDAAEKVLALDPENVYAHWLRAECFWWTNRYVEREQALRDALAIDPLDFDCLVGLAAIAADRGREEEAYRVSGSAIGTYPARPFAWQCRAYVALKFGDWEEAERCARKALELSPANARLHATLGSALAGQKRAVEAIECFERALELDPNEQAAAVSLARTMLFVGHHDEGHALNRRLHEAAFAQRDHEARVKPSARTLERRAFVARRFAGHDAATADARRAVEADPTSLHARLTLAEQHLLAGDRVAAIAALGDPSDWETEEPVRLTWLVRLATYADAPEFIAVAIPQIRTISPRHERRRTAEAWYALAQGEWTEAERRFADELRPAPGLCCMKVGLGIACAAQGKRDAARECLEEATAVGSCNCFQIRTLEERLAAED
jgi:tetratricopeptide (TPR) repeat protein